METLLVELEKALGRGAFSGNELVQRNGEVLRERLGERAAEIQRHVASFAYDAAQRVLRGARTATAS